MSRLTKKELKEKFGFYPIWIGNDCWVANEATDKLGQLENVEDRLGFTLLTLFSVRKVSDIIHHVYIKKSIVDKNGRNMTVYEKRKIYDFQSKDIITVFTKNYENIDAYYIKDYGKTWALTKEEFLCQKNI